MRQVIFKRMKWILGLFSAIGAAAFMAGCTTMESIQSDAPRYTMEYSGVARGDLVACARPRLAALGEKRLIVKPSESVTVIESYARTLVPVPGSGYMRQNLPRMATHFYDNRVTIYDRDNVPGADGSAYLPVIEQCVKELGGDTTAA